MKEIYTVFFRKVLVTCFLLFPCLIVFAQPQAPQNVTSSQLVCYQQPLNLEAECTSGAPHWFSGSSFIGEGTVSVTPESTTKYMVACVTPCDDISDPVEITITVYKPYDVIRSQSICTDGTKTLTASCPGGGVVVWYGTDTTEPLTTAGSYFIEPTVTTTYNVHCENGGGDCVSPFEPITIYVNSDPNSDPTGVTPATAICEGGSITLSASCADEAQPFFYLDYGITETPSTIENLTTETTYYVRCESFDKCPSEFVSVIISIGPLQVPSEVTEGGDVCPGEVVTLAATCAEGASPVWFLDDETSFLLDPTVTITETITYKVRCYSNSVLNCASEFATPVVFTVTSSITSQPVSQLICMGDNAVFSVTASGTPTYQWQKKMPDGAYYNMSLATGNTLTIENAGAEDKAFYRCLVGGTCNEYSEEVFLTFQSKIVEKGKLTGSDITAENMFGSAVAIGNDLAVVGAPDKAFKKGAAYVFKKNNDGKWSQLHKLAPVSLNPFDVFGSSVAIAGDTVYVGAPGANDDKGMVYVFKKNGDDTWSDVQVIEDGSGAAGDFFGSSLSVSGWVLAIGAGEFEGGYGKVFIYEKEATESEWNEAAGFSPYDLEEESYMGYSVAVSGNTVIAGAEGDNLTGTVWVFERDETGSWYEKTVLAPDDLSYGDWFGYSVSIDGNVIYAGAPAQNYLEGAAYVFKKDAFGSWTQKSKLVPEDITDFAGFGYSVAVKGINAVVGAFGNDFGKGTAYVYELNTSDQWVQKARLQPAARAIGDQYGYSVAISANTVITGAASILTPFFSVTEPTGGFATFHEIFTIPAPAVTAVAQSASVCPTLSATFNLTGLPSADTYTISYKIDVSGTEKTAVVTADTLGKASFSESLLWVNNTKNIILTKIKNNTTTCEKVLNLTGPLTVKAPTQITAHPQNETVCQGETAVFMAEATGEGILTFQWQKQAPVPSGNIPLTNDFVDIGVLSLPNRMPSDSGSRYRVKIAGECGVITSDDAMLSVLKKASVIMTAGGSVCPGSTGTLIFAGTPNAEVFYKTGSVTSSVTLNSSGTATVSTGVLNQDTDFSLVSINLAGRCDHLIGGTARIEMLLTSLNPPRTLSSPVNDVLADDRQKHAAETIEASNKVESGGKETLIGNKAVMLQPGFSARSGSVFTAKIAATCI